MTDVSTHLQSKLKGVPQKDPSFDGKPAGNELILMSSKVHAEHSAYDQR